MLRAPWLVLILSLAACSPVRPSPDGPTGNWYLSEFRLATDAPARAPEGGKFTLSLQKGGEASGLAACNRWQGRYTVTAGALVVENPSRTRRRCIINDESTVRLESLFLTRLESGAHFSTSDNGLVLEFADGLRWHFVKHATKE